jgi:ADP-ribose pyrophosphatase
MSIPMPPQIKIAVKDSRIVSEPGFLNLNRSEVNFHYPDGTSSESCTVDCFIRGTNDAVGILAWFRNEYGINIYLRSCIRPALALRNYSFSAAKEGKDIGNLWEIPAGGIDEEDKDPLEKDALESVVKGYDIIYRAASRELHEEIGFKIPYTQLKFLGKRIFLDPGSSGTRIFLLHCEVDPATREDPICDGSPMESHGEVLIISLKEALKAIDEGYIIDSYTQIGISRLSNLLHE